MNSLGHPNTELLDTQGLLLLLFWYLLRGLSVSLEFSCPFLTPGLALSYLWNALSSLLQLFNFLLLFKTHFR